MRGAELPGPGGAGVGASEGTLRLGRWERLRVFVRSFAIQGSWNERTMQGGGFGFALLPGLQAIHRDDPEGLQEAVRRHVEHFNAHPYLADLALGAVLRLEAEGAPPDEIRRFKAALKGPLGTLGDTLVWAGWLPACSLLGVALAFGGAGPWMAVLVFLGLYNLGHLALRGWVFRLGLEAGREVGGRLRELGLARRSALLARTGTFLLGVVLGLGVARGIDGVSVPLPLLALGGLLLAAGTARGLELRRPAWILFLSMVALFLFAGVVR